LRRRPVLVVASVAAICLGALVAVCAYTSLSTASEVVAMRSTVQRGELISREDLIAVRVGVDPALNPIPADQLDSIAGQRAAMDLAAGGLVTKDSVTPTVIPARDMSVVGVALPASLMPGEPLQAGDEVRVVATPGQQGLTWLNLVSSGCVLDSADGGSGVVVEGCAGVEDVVAGLDGDAAVAAQGLHEFLDRPGSGVRASG
jgi:hypothetical protein